MFFYPSGKDKIKKKYEAQIFQKTRNIRSMGGMTRPPLWDSNVIAGTIEVAFVIVIYTL